MKHLLTIIASCLAVFGSAQVVDTTYNGNEVQINLNFSELSSTISQLESDVSQLNEGQTTTNSSSNTGVIIEYALCFISSSTDPYIQADYLIECVNDSITAGWSPFGGPVLDHADAWQVIVKYSE